MINLGRKNRWQLKKAVRIIKQIVSKLKLSLHSEKKFIGRISRGFDFLGYFLNPTASLDLLKKVFRNSKNMYGGFMSRERTTTISCCIFKDGYAIFTEG